MVAMYREEGFISWKKLAEELVGQRRTGRGARIRSARIHGSRPAGVDDTSPENIELQTDREDRQGGPATDPPDQETSGTQQQDRGRQN